MLGYSIGGHYTQGQQLLANMNMPPAVSTSHYKDIIHIATENAAPPNMMKSIEEVSGSLIVM